MNIHSPGMPTARAFAIVFIGLLFVQTSLSVDQEGNSGLEELRNRYEAHLSLMNRPLVQLADNYEKALSELKQKLQTEANLDGLVVLTEEMTRFKKDRQPAPKLSPFVPLAQLQEIYAAHHRAAKEKMLPEWRASHSAYRAKLEQLMLKLTTAGDVENALKVRSALEQLGDAPETAPTLETGLVLHLRFENETGDVVRDQSGKDNHGRLIGDAKNHSTGEARKSYAVLDGRGDFIECSHADSLTLTTHGTISVWVRPRQLRSMRGLVSKYNPQKSYTLRTWKEGEQSKVAFGDTSDNFLSKPELRENRWTHIAVTLNDLAVTFYIDGKLNTVGSREAPITTNTSPVRIGSDYDGRYFHGAIDDIRIYNRSLTAEEVARIFREES